MGGKKPDKKHMSEALEKYSGKTGALREDAIE